MLKKKYQMILNLMMVCKDVKVANEVNSRVEKETNDLIKKLIQFLLHQLIMSVLNEGMHAACSIEEGIEM